MSGGTLFDDLKGETEDKTHLNTQKKNSLAKRRTPTLHFYVISFLQVETKKRFPFNDSDILGIAPRFVSVYFAPM